LARKPPTRPFEPLNSLAQDNGPTNLGASLQRMDWQEGREAQYRRH
jgi:hypothetical protein